MIDAIAVSFPKKTNIKNEDGTETEVSSSTPKVREA